jgi:transposase
VPLGWRTLLKNATHLLSDVDGPVPELLRGALLEQLESLRTATSHIDALEKRIQQWQRSELNCRRLADIPGVGPLIASAVVASVADAKQFRSAREFAAYLGLVPRQSGTGGRVKLLGISKRGDGYLRMLFIQGARSVLISHARRHRDRPLDRWLSDLLQRRSSHVVAVALANKMARTIWALLAHARTFDANWHRAVAA